MSEDFHQLSGELEGPGQPLAEAGSAQEAKRPKPVSESVIPEQPVAAQEAEQPQYPPLPEFYAQMPVVDPYNAPGAPSPVFPPPDQGRPGFPPPVQGAPVFPLPGYGYSFPPFPQVQPLPLGQALRELPRQYKKVLLKPGPRSFAEEQGKADWGIIWLQVLFLTVLQTAVSIPLFLSYNRTLANNASMASSGMDMSVFSSPTILLLEIALMFILTLLVFFASVGIQYLVARAFKGLGSFKQQAYNQLLFQVPIGVFSSLISLVVSSFAGSTLASNITAPTSVSTASSVSGPALFVLLLFDLVSLGMSAYSVVLNVFSLMATHRMSGGKATASVLIPYGILMVLGMFCACALGAVLAVTISGTTHP